MRAVCNPAPCKREETLSESIGYENVRCRVQVSPACKRKGGNKGAGYSRRQKYAQEGPWIDACEECARVPYEQPKQFQDGNAEPRILQMKEAT